MTTPRSPRGRKAKGNQGEREVKDILEARGFPCVNGAMTEPGVDLWINPEIAVEVKNCPWSSIGGSKRKEMLAAASYQRAQGRPHWVITHEKWGWQVAEIHRATGGQIGLLYRRPIAYFNRERTPLQPGGGSALGARAPPHAESRAVNADQGEPDTGKTETPLMKQAARPAMPSSMIEHRKVLDVTHVASAVCPFCDRDGPEA